MEVGRLDGLLWTEDALVVVLEELRGRLRMEGAMTEGAGASEAELGEVACCGLWESLGRCFGWVALVGEGEGVSARPAGRVRLTDLGGG